MMRTHDQPHRLFSYFHSCPLLIPLCNVATLSLIYVFFNQRYQIMQTLVEIGPSNA